MNWFYFHCILALVILYKDHNGTLERDLDRFELSIGIRTELPSDTNDTRPPYYIPPIEEEVDSTWILPDSLRIEKNG